MNLEKTKNSIPENVFKGVSKVPIWAWMIILGITSAFASFYQANLVVNSYVSVYNIFSTKTFLAVMLVLVAVIHPFLIRLFTRLDYSVASRMYFRRTIYVPDYNLRRLPIPYNDFLRTILFVYSIVNALRSVLNIAMIACPYAVYLFKIPEFIIKLLMFVFALFMLKPFVSEWQYKNVYFSIGLPTVILLILSLWVGV